MIDGALIAITIYAVVLIIRGRPLGKNAPDRAYAGYRWMGAFLLTAAPAAIAAIAIITAVNVVQNPNLSEAALKERLSTPTLIVGLSTILTYGIAGFLWERALKRRYGLK